MSVLVLSSVAALACPVCFRIEDDATAAGVRAAVIVLLAVTVTVLGGVAAFVVRRGPYLFFTDSGSSGTGLEHPDDPRPVPDLPESVENRYGPL